MVLLIKITLAYIPAMIILMILFAILGAVSIREPGTGTRHEIACTHPRDRPPPSRALPEMSRRRSPFVPLLALSLCAALVYLYFTPYLALRKMQGAAESGDTRALAALVDFESLRASARDEVRAAASRGIGGENPGTIGRVGGFLAGALAGAVADPLVNGMMTPEGVTLLLKGRALGEERRDSEGRDWREDVRISRVYEGAGRFLVRYHDRESGDERLALVMEREGLGWRLVGVRLGGER